MADNINKVIYGGNVLIDLTADTVVADKVASGYKFHDASGAILTGTSTFDADTSSATAKAAEILSGKTAFVKGAKVTGTMTNRGAVAGTITSVTGAYTIPQGYHDGAGTVKIADADTAKLIAANIKQGITILGVEGTLRPSDSVNVQSRIVTPTTTSQEVLPEEGFELLSSVTVNAIPYSEVANSAGGLTVTIA